MSALEIRRHSVRDKPDEHLSREGRKLARQVGGTTGPFERVVSSPARRAVETADEMGFLVSDVRESWWELPAAAADVWPSPFDQYAQLLRVDAATQKKAHLLMVELKGLLRVISSRGAGLIVTHGGFPELIAVGLFPSANHLAWGGPVRCLEGVRISFEGAKPRECQILRLPPTVSRM
jgi:hypothetical protein